MRLLVDDKNAYDFLVFLDKKLMGLCMMADEDEGVVEVIKTEDNTGKAITDENDEVVTETLHGDVVITTRKSGKLLNDLWKQQNE